MTKPYFQKMYQLVRFLYFYALFGCCFSVNTSSIDCLDRHVPKVTCFMLSDMLNPTHSREFYMCNLSKYRIIFKLHVSFYMYL